ncbi:hypothetical protein [Xenorhabdus szentirmaii]|nr:MULTISPECIES: hypothetical protein [Xenorhabdus]MBD2821919.1 hypothetical protein [Xenorhabdus sp. 42]
MFKRSDYQVTPLSGQRPEHVRPAFTTHLNPELLSDTTRNKSLTDSLFD